MKKAKTLPERILTRLSPLRDHVLSSGYIISFRNIANKLLSPAKAFDPRSRLFPHYRFSSPRLLVALFKCLQTRLFSGLGWSYIRALAWGRIALCSWAGHFTLTVPLSTQVYKWVPANLVLRGGGGGGNPAMAWHPIQRGVKIPPVASCYRNRDKLRPDEPRSSQT